MLRIKGWCCKMDSDGIRDSPDTTRLDRLDPTSVIRFVRAAFGLVDRLIVPFSRMPIDPKTS